MELLEPDFYANGLNGALDISGNGWHRVVD
jgi:hypothetical protein